MSFPSATASQRNGRKARARSRRQNRCRIDALHVGIAVAGFIARGHRGNNAADNAPDITVPTVANALLTPPLEPHDAPPSSRSAPNSELTRVPTVNVPHAVNQSRPSAQPCASARPRVALPLIACELSARELNG